MDQWLIRTAENVVAGPYTRDQVRQLVHEGKLTHQDEVCPANGYWFFLHEREEVLKLLGLELPRPPSDGDDTDTQTENIAAQSAASARAAQHVAQSAHHTVKTGGASMAVSGAVSGAVASAPHEDDAIPELAENPDLIEEQTSMLGREMPPAAREAVAHEVATSEVVAPTPILRKAAENPTAPLSGAAHASRSASSERTDGSSAWKGVAWLLVSGVVILVVIVLKMLKSN